MCKIDKSVLDSITKIILYQLNATCHCFKSFCINNIKLHLCNNLAAD